MKKRSQGALANSPVCKLAPDGLSRLAHLERRVAQLEKEHIQATSRNNSMDSEK